MPSRRNHAHRATYESPMADGFAHYDVAIAPSYDDFSTTNSSYLSEPSSKAYEDHVLQATGWADPSISQLRQRKPLNGNFEMSTGADDGTSVQHFHPRMFLCWVVQVPCRQPNCRSGADEYDAPRPMPAPAPRKVKPKAEKKPKTGSILKRVKSRCKSAWLGPEELRHATYGY